jgi:clan AA aspartic protease
MGINYVEGTVRGPHGEEVAVRFLVDSGASYSLLPKAVWEKIGLETKRDQNFVLADGTMVRRQISECLVILPQGEAHTPVVLGEASDGQALLGVVTLEEMGLVFNPFSRTLHPMRMLLA